MQNFAAYKHSHQTLIRESTRAWADPEKSFGCPENVIKPLTYFIFHNMGGSRGGAGGPDPPMKNHKHQYWSGSPEKAQSYQVIVVVFVWNKNVKFGPPLTKLSGSAHAKEGAVRTSPREEGSNCVLREARTSISKEMRFSWGGGGVRTQCPHIWIHPK